MSESDPARLGDLVDRWGASRGIGRARTVAAVFEGWDAIVGPVIAAQCRPVELRATRLVVETEDPAWASQLRWLAPELLARLAATAGAGAVEEIAVRVARGPGRDGVRRDRAGDPGDHRSRPPRW